MNTTVKLSTVHTEAERHNTQRYKQTNRQNDRQTHDSRSHCVQQYEYDRLKRHDTTTK